MTQSPLPQTQDARPETLNPGPQTPDPKPNAPRAWEADAFWHEVVTVMTGGKKLRSAHYLETLTAPGLDQLRQALSGTGSLREQQQLCPRRRGGGLVGMLPDLALLGRLAAAIRQAAALRHATVENAIVTAQEHCQSLGIDPDLTNRVLRILANQVVDKKVKRPFGAVAVATANVLVRTEDMRSKKQENAVKIKFRERAEDRLDERLQLAWEKLQFDAAKKVLPLLPEMQAIQKDNTLTDFEKLNQIRLKLFGRIAEDQPQPKI